MSGQWEVVGKKKDKQNNKITAPTKPKDKKIANGVKVEEVLPMSQIKNLYAAGKNKENQKPQEKVKVENNTKKVQKKVEKPQEPKPKVPKSIESALNSIKPDEFNAIYEKNKALFPDTPIVWLKEMAQFLNLRVPVDVQDPIFSNKAENYPLSVMPTSIRNIIEKAVKESGSDNASVFFDICLTAMANDMNKDLPALGHKFFLQYLATTNPKHTVNNISKYVTLRNSYQNRQPIGLSILWALGQGGTKDVTVGMKVFQEMMLPLLEMKNYTRFVLKYLINLIKKHKESNLSKEQYLLILDIAYSNKKNINTDLNNELTESISVANEMVLKKCGTEKYHSYIEPFLKKMTQISNGTCRNQLCEILVACLERDHNCMGTWGKIYTKYLMSSAILLDYIEQNWKVVCKKINIKIFAELLKMYTVTNEELFLKKKKDDGLVNSIDAIKRLSNKMAHKKKGSSVPYKTVTLMLLAVLSGFLYYDVKQNGSWDNSQTSKALNRTGFYVYSNNAMTRCKEGTQWVHTRIEEQFPGFTERTLEITMPYVELGRDMSLFFKEIATNSRKALEAKVPQILATVDSYAPGLIDKVQSTGDAIVATVATYYDKTTHFLFTEVFVGKLAPEEIRNKIASSAQASVDKINEFYFWMHEKAQQIIK